MRDYPEEFDQEPEGERLRLFRDTFQDFESLVDFYRGHYRASACGVSVGALVAAWETSVVGACTVAESQRVQRWVYCSDLGKLGTLAEMESRGQDILALSVSSIVEGVDEEVAPVVVAIPDPEDEGASEALAQAWDLAVEDVEACAACIWNATHGCETCQAWWESQGLPNGESDGFVVVWTECPACGGQGAIL